MLSGSLGDGLITRPEESYRLWLIVVCDQETSKTRRLKPATGLWKIKPQCVVTPRKQTNKQTSKQTMCSITVSIIICNDICFGKSKPEGGSRSCPRKVVVC
jgi:hypothetical protein